MMAVVLLRVKPVFQLYDQDFLQNISVFIELLKVRHLHAVILYAMKVAVKYSIRPQKMNF